VAADVDGMAWVTDRVGTPILADESVYGVRDLWRVIRQGAPTWCNVKLAKCGGLGPARTLLELAPRNTVWRAIVGSMMESHVGVGAAAALVSAYPTTAVNDLDAAWWLREPPVSRWHSLRRLADPPAVGSLARRDRLDRMKLVAAKVPVSTVWTSPDAPRDIDARRPLHRPDVAAWAKSMDTEIRSACTAGP
jgi:L-alanine-DL-glutamate epimerase-like enolase superfamily enzyme